MRMRLIQPPVERLYNSVTMLPAQPLAEKTDEQPKNFQSKRAEVLGFFALLLIIDCYLYFRNPGHFFQPDTIYLLSQRVTSITEFLREFTKLHGSGWYRPLTNETIESILFPIFGLNPVAYRIPVYALFIADTIAVYAVSLAITRRQMAAVIATFFFNIHIVNASTTYDVAFTPELLYTLFYIGSVLAYLRYLDCGAKSARRISLACFVGSLLSKEAAVTLPLTLVAVHVFTPARSETAAHASLWRRFAAALRSARGHFVVLFIYTAVVVVYLHVGGVTLTSLLQPKEVEGPNYEMFIDRSMLKNLDMALTWAFNIPRGWWAQFRHATPVMVTFLKIFRGLSAVLVVLLLLKGERSAVLLGLMWFFLTLMPVLPLRDHFVFYYLFLPIVGLAMTIGTAFAWLSDNLRSFYRLLPAAILIPIFTGLLYVCSAGIRHEIQENPLLGDPAALALKSINELKQLYPVFAPDAIIYIDDSEHPLSGLHFSGALIKMAYNLDNISVLYSSESAGAPPLENAATGRLVVLKVENGRLVDNTAAFRDNLAYGDDSGAYVLKAFPNQVVAGRDSYSLRIAGAKDVPVRIVYRLNDGAPEEFTAQLDATGESRFYVSPDTRKGVYRFIEFNITGQLEWIRSQATITVR